MALSEEAARFAAFYREHYSLILTTCIRRLGDRATAEDAAAEVFRVAWQRFPEQKDPTFAWLYVVVHHVVGNEYRRSSRARALRDRLEQVAVDAIPDEDGAEVREAMAALRPRDRELLYMAYWERLSGQEIAQVLQISVSAVWVRLSRARNALRNALGYVSADRDGRDG
ncbi:MAG: RNA polymerase subunit sigma-70 [Leifsonia xyli]|nr:MAG: RNA polymerase subunit sigma-70 [Leifsonia xyli]